MYSKTLDLRVDFKVDFRVDFTVDFRVEKYRKYYSSHWKVVIAPDQSQKLSNNQL